MLRPMMRIGLATFALSIFGTPGHVAAQAQPTFNWEEAIAPGALLHVVTVAGEITVVASPDGTARVRGRAVEPRRGARGEADLRFEVVREGGNVTICAMGASGSCTAEGARETAGGGRDRWRADFTVEIPSGVRLHAGSGNGPIRVEGTTASVRAATGNGRLESDFSSNPPGRRRAGSFATVIGDGALRIQTSTGNGSVELRRHPHPGNSGIGR